MTYAKVLWQEVGLHALGLKVQCTCYEENTRDLLREVRDDKEIRESRSQQAKSSRPPAEDYSYPVGALQTWFFLKQHMKTLA